MPRITKRITKKEIELTRRIALKRKQWEEAWEEYVEALNAREKHYRSDCPMGRGSGHAERVTYARLKKATLRLRKLDPEFCEQLDI